MAVLRRRWVETRRDKFERYKKGMLDTIELSAPHAAAPRGYADEPSIFFFLFFLFELGVFWPSLAAKKINRQFWGAKTGENDGGGKCQGDCKRKQPYL
jgi:hypothetical protein